MRHSGSCSDRRSAFRPLPVDLGAHRSPVSARPGQPHRSANQARLGSQHRQDSILTAVVQTVRRGAGRAQGLRDVEADLYAHGRPGSACGPVCEDAVRHSRQAPPHPLEYILRNATAPDRAYHGNVSRATSVVDYPVVTGRSTADSYLTGQKGGVGPGGPHPGSSGDRDAQAGADMTRSGRFALIEQFLADGLDSYVRQSRHGGAGVPGRAGRVPGDEVRADAPGERRRDGRRRLCPSTPQACARAARTARPAWAMPSVRSTRRTGATRRWSSSAVMRASGTCPWRRRCTATSWVWRGR